MINYNIYENGWEGIERKELSDLIESSFNKRLVDGFFNKVTPKYLVIAEEDGKYYGAAIVEGAKTDGNALGFDYVNKLAVSKEKRKNGVANKLMSIVDSESKNYVLRADPENRVANDFYQKEGPKEGRQFLYQHKGESWNVYLTYGVISEGLKKKAIQYALAQPVTLVKM